MGQSERFVMFRTLEIIEHICKTKQTLTPNPKNNPRTDSKILTLGSAPLLLGLISPCAYSGFVVEDQTSWTGDHVELSIDTVIECVADGLISVGEVTVLARTILRRTGCFCKEVYPLKIKYEVDS